MLELLDAKIRKEVKVLFDKLSHDVRLLFFKSEHNCPYCSQQQKLLAEIASLSDKVVLTVHDRERDKKQTELYGIDKVPATLVIVEKDYGIRFFGLTTGHEFSSLIQTIAMIGSDQTGLHPELKTLVQKIDKPVHIEVMVTLTCPYCPQAVQAAHQLAMANENIRSDMVESAEFPDLAKQYNVYSTPHTVINGTHSFVGAQPVQAVYFEVLKAVDPDEHQRIEAMMREANGHRHVRKPDAGQVYHLIIVGGGPAAMSAAVYAARKQINVLLVSKDIGGQITYTAQIDNYLGLPGVSGEDMKERFMVHMEHYPIAESLGVEVMSVAIDDSLFTIRLEDKKVYKAHSLIYCAGKEYQRLGVPGEEKFIGRGIAFCATCDAPLYRDKKVAVIGGGNSAFTAVRDLIGYAREIHLVHRRDKYTADNALVQEIKKSPLVTLHTNMTIQEFVGEETLTGVKLKSLTAEKDLELQADGVFLEIGLSPNTVPVKDLISLNKLGEIPVQHDNSTSVPGFFAAGDVTDVPEKQIIVAAGEGAKAAVSAYRYLVNKKLIQKTSEDTW